MSQRWEYMVSAVSVGGAWEQMQADLNPWGEAGWELVSVVYHSSYEYILTAFWKRPLDDNS